MSQKTWEIFSKTWEVFQKTWEFFQKRRRICFYHRFPLAPISQQTTEVAQNRVKFEGSKCKVFFCHDIPRFVIETCISCALLHLGEERRREDSYSANSAQLFFRCSQSTRADRLFPAPKHGTSRAQEGHLLERKVHCAGQDNKMNVACSQQESTPHLE